MVLNEREYKYWITKNCDRRHCWVVVAQLGDMIRHENTVVYHESTPVSRETLSLTHDGLEYVYLVDFSDSRLIALIQDKDYYYLLDNSEITKQEGDEQIKDYTSSITYSKTLVGLIKTLSGSMRKKLNLKLSSKAKLKSSEITQLKGVVAIDFIGADHLKQVELFKRYAGGSTDAKCLDLSGLYILDPQVIVDTNMEFNHDQIVLYQNNRFCEFSWLKCFPKVKTLSMWYINTVTNEAIDTLVSSAPSLNTLEFHSCFQLNGRILIPISKLNLLEKLIINYEQCNLQEHTYETVITDDEWSAIHNTGLSVVLIDSLNLTLDFIHFFLKSFKGVDHFIMNEVVLDKLKTNSASGCKDREEPIMFHSVKDTTQGFKRYRDVKVYDLVRDKGGCTFSPAMLKKIKERNPERTDIVDQLEA